MRSKGFRHGWNNDQLLQIDSAGVKKAKVRRYFRQLREANTDKPKAAMLFYGDEPTGDIRAMRLVDIHTENKRFRAEFFDAPDDARMYECRYKNDVTKATRKTIQRKQAQYAGAVLQNNKPRR